MPCRAIAAPKGNGAERIKAVRNTGVDPSPTKLDPVILTGVVTWSTTPLGQQTGYPPWQLCHKARSSRWRRTQRPWGPCREARQACRQLRSRHGRLYRLHLQARALQAVATGGTLPLPGPRRPLRRHPTGARLGALAASLHDLSGGCNRNGTRPEPRRFTALQVKMLL